MRDIWEFAQRNMDEAQQRQKAQADRHRRDVDFQVGDKVMVTTRNWDLGRPSHKLGHQAAGPYPIIEKVGNSYRLQLDPGIDVHPVFSPDKLRLASSSEPLPGQIADPSPPIEIDGHKEWEVEQVLDSRIRWKKLYYCVKWVGHDNDSKQYLAGYLKNAPQKLKGFYELYLGKPGPPIRLPIWLEAEQKDDFIEDSPLDGCVTEA